MRRRIINIEVLLAVAVMIFAAGFSTAFAEEQAAPTRSSGDDTTPASTETAPQPGWLERDTLTGDWGGGRTWLKEHGITLKPRLAQFYQGLTSGEGDHSFEYGGKADLLLNADLSKLGLWKGLSLTVHAEQNFGQSVNFRGGALLPVNTALMFPGIEGGNAFDLSSVYFGQTFGDSVSLRLGKLNLIDLYASKPFQGGAGIDSFWHLTFAAPPSGTVPAYLFGALLSVKTKPVTISVWVYDPNSVVNKSGFDQPFHEGVTIRSSFEFPVTIGGLVGHQGFVATYSNKNGTDFETLDDVLLPSPTPGTVGIKNNRYYFGYTVNQYLYQSKRNPKEGLGLFGQFGISDGNPNPLYWSGFGGVGGTGLIPGRSRDTWGVGYYYDALSDPLKDAVSLIRPMRNEGGWDLFYSFSVTPWLDLGADLQIIKPSLAEDRAVFTGLRTVIRF